MSVAPTNPANEVKAESLRTIGAMVCLYVELELAVRRLIDVLLAPMPLVETEAFLATHRLQPPLRPLRVLITARYADEPLKLRKFKRWRNRVTKLLRRRNTVIHGSWIDEHGSLRFNRYPRRLGDGVRGPLSVSQVASDVRLLTMDIATITAWIHAYRPVPHACA